MAKYNKSESYSIEFEEVVRKRKMIREYEFDRPIPDYIIVMIIENAHRAPSAGHTQVQEFIVVKDHLTKSKIGDAALGQNKVYDAVELIIVCSNTSRSVGRYGKRGWDFYSIVHGAFPSLLMLLPSVNEGISACFVGAFEDEKISILNLPKHVKHIRAITLGYPLKNQEDLKGLTLPS